MDLDTDNKVLVLLEWLHYLLVGTMTESEIETGTGTEPYTRYHGTSLVSV